MSGGGLKLLAVGALVLAACAGDRNVADGGAKPSAICAVDAAGKAAPFPTEFLFRNDTGAPVFLHKGCIGIEYGVSSCAAGFRDRVGPAYHCTCLCDEASCVGPPACGPCPSPEGVMIAAGGVVAVDWDAVHVSEHEKAGPSGGTFTCVRSALLPAGRYRVSIRVFDDAASGASGIGGRLVTVDFSLPSADMVVEVPLARGAQDW